MKKEIKIKVLCIGLVVLGFFLGHFFWPRVVEKDLFGCDPKICSPTTEMEAIERIKNGIIQERQKFLCEKAGGKIMDVCSPSGCNMCKVGKKVYEWQNDNWVREENL